MVTIELTESAKNQIEKLCLDNDLYAVTLGMKGGGCAGFEYDWDSAKSQDEIVENSTIVEAGQGRLVVEPMSLIYLIGSTIDYKTSIIGSQFEIDNPMSKSSCGCGVSINIDMDKVMEVEGNLGTEVK
jgi:iron-sulfur cluster assembly accessory protein